MSQKEIKQDFKIKDKTVNLKSKEWKTKVKIIVQRCGSFMAGMIMPSVSILIAWGLLAAAFLGKYDNGVWVRTGWFKSEAIGQLIGPSMKYLIPTLIGYTAGNMIYKTRGAVFGAFTTFAIIIGSDWIYEHMIQDWRIGDSTAGVVKAPNQIVGAMIIAPLTTYLYKTIELTYINKVRPGYEMVVKNFSLALWAIAFGLAAYFTWGFALYGISFVMVAIIDFFTLMPWMFPFMSIVTEPLRAVFLNNALNYGVMIPLGLTEVEQGKGFSSFFMVGGNPGPGFGLLIAYAVWRKKQRGAASSSSLIQLIGGIHEVHYVYILSEPIMILSTIAGAFVSLSIVSIFSGGAVAAISPGSLISVISLSGSGYRIAINTLAVFAGALASFLVASLIMFFKRKSNTEVMSMNVTDEGISFEQEEDKKQESSKEVVRNFKDAKILKVACDAGVGSSAMAAGIVRKWVKANDIDLEVSNCAVKDLTPDVDIVITMTNFKEVAQQNSPNAYIYPVKQYLGKNIFDDLYEKILKDKKG
ncbi:PTS mannitol transporter subunit IICB [Spiroplasma chinense]|uniref:PTS mannitol transporter subunit IICB n=1 Tax=Spiroplasma chinense TaxID=216932 RepID=A0A5B9Y540_9MOLU|nr:PTS mannitol transporter subunit IICB [Spiroplasma chinense]QEH62161.1 PTS mannitol transporter subunit IICB [Spiroplasma chinense]